MYRAIWAELNSGLWTELGTPSHRIAGRAVCMPRGANGLHGERGYLGWRRMKRIESLGIIAGNRSLPLLLARQARNMEVGRLVAVGFEGETDPGLEKLVDRMHWLR